MWALIIVLVAVSTVSCAVPSPTLKENLAQIDQNAGKVTICGDNLGTSGYLLTLTCGTQDLLLNANVFGNTAASGNLGDTGIVGAIDAEYNYVEPIVLNTNGIYEYADLHGTGIGEATATATGAISANAQGCFVLFMQRIPTTANTFTSTIQQCDMRASYKRTSVPIGQSAVTTIAKVNRKKITVVNKNQKYFSDAFTYFLEGSGFPNMFPGMPNEGQYINYIDAKNFNLLANTGRNPTGVASPNANAAITINLVHKTNSGQINTVGGNNLLQANGGLLPAGSNAINGIEAAEGRNQLYITSINAQNVATAVSDVASGVLEADGGDDVTDRIVRCMIFYSSDSLIKCRRGPGNSDVGGDTLLGTDDDDDLFIDATLLVGGDRIALAGLFTVGPLGNADPVTLPTNRVFGTVINKIIPTVFSQSVAGANPTTIKQNDDEITITGSGFDASQIDSYFIRFGFVAAPAAATNSKCRGTSGLSFLPSIFGPGRATAAARDGDQVTNNNDGGHSTGIALDFGFWGSYTKAAVPKVCQPVSINNEGTKLVCKLLVRFPPCHSFGCVVSTPPNENDGCVAAVTTDVASLQVQVHSGFQPSSHSQIQTIGLVTYVEPKVDASATKVAFSDVITFTGQGFDINYMEYNRLYFEISDGTRVMPTSHCADHQRSVVNPTGIIRRSSPAFLTPSAYYRIPSIGYSLLSLSRTSFDTINDIAILYSADQCRETFGPSAYHNQNVATQDGGASRCATIDRTGTKLICHVAIPLNNFANIATFLAQEPEIQVSLPRSFANNFAPAIVQSAIAYFGSSSATIANDVLSSLGSGSGIASLMGYDTGEAAANKVFWALNNIGGVAAPANVNGASNDVIEHRGAVGVVVNGVIGGDPHVFGLLGEKFLFNGEIGKSYSIISNNELQVNGLLHAYAPSNTATVFREVGLKFNSTKITVDAGGNKLGSMNASVSINGNKIALSYEPVQLKLSGEHSKATLKAQLVNNIDSSELMHQFHHNTVAIVDITLEHFIFQFALIEEGKDSNGVWHKQPRRYIDFSFTLMTHNIKSHGILGQTAHLRKGVRSVSDDWTIEGSSADYEVSHLFAHDSKFNKFVEL